MDKSEPNSLLSVVTDFDALLKAMLAVPKPPKHQKKEKVVKIKRHA
jgi:hypothetical protein